MNPSWRQHKNQLNSKLFHQFYVHYRTQNTWKDYVCDFDSVAVLHCTCNSTQWCLQPTMNSMPAKYSPSELRLYCLYHVLLELAFRRSSCVTYVLPRYNESPPTLTNPLQTLIIRCWINPYGEQLQCPSNKWWHISCAARAGVRPELMCHLRTTPIQQIPSDTYQSSTDTYNLVLDQSTWRAVAMPEQ